MSSRSKFQIGMSIVMGILFLGIAVYQWLHLHTIEVENKGGEFSTILKPIYDMAGKSGVVAIYMPFVFYCFWRAYTIYRQNKSTQNNEIDE